MMLEDRQCYLGRFVCTGLASELGGRLSTKTTTLRNVFPLAESKKKKKSRKVFGTFAREEQLCVVCQVCLAQSTV